MKAAVITNGVVTNLVVVANLNVLPNLVAADSADIGDLWDGTRFSKPPPSDFQRAAKLAEIDSSRLAANTRTFPFSGKEFSVDALGRSDLDATAIYVALNNALPDSWPGVWKATDGTTVPITNVAQFRALYKAMVDTGTTNFIKAETLKAQVAAATTLAQLNAIRW